MPGLDQFAEYVVRVDGSIDAHLADWLGPVDVGRAATDGDRCVTTLAGIVTDQAGIVGLIRHLHGLGVVLLSVERVVPR